MTTGVLLINTGTPDAPEVPAICAYLQEFLMDPIIIGAPRVIRKLIVGRICKTRPHRTVEIYKQYWTDEGSPFLLTCLEQAGKLQEALASTLGDDTRVIAAMRYGNPSIADGLARLCDAGCDRIVLLPSYPQQVNVCAGTCLKECDAQLAILAEQGWQPTVRRVPSFCQQPRYLQALADSIARAWTWHPGAKLVFSFHSTMLHDIEHGDPYRDQIEMTAREVAKLLNLPAEDVLITYQSRFDGRKWLQPFTEPTLVALAEQGVRDLCVVCPIFTASNIETTFEVDRNLRRAFLDACQKEGTFTHVPELNCDPGLIGAMADAVMEALTSETDASIAEIALNPAIPSMLPRDDEQNPRERR